MMLKENKLETAQKKLLQYEHKKILQENRSKDINNTIDLRRKILVGEMFLKYFPIALEFTPGKSTDENALIFEPLDNFMQSLFMCQQAFLAMEDALVQQH